MKKNNAKMLTLSKKVGTFPSPSYNTKQKHANQFFFSQVPKQE